MRIAIMNAQESAVAALQRALAATPEHQVAWFAHDGLEGVQRCAEDTPDLILMDVVLPGLDGVEATRRIMAQSPCAIVIVTTSVDASAGRVFDAMGAGALDAVDTPVNNAAGGGDVAPLLAKIRTIARLVSADAKNSGGPSAAKTHLEERAPLVAIGSSAGGPPALVTVLKALPRDIPAAIVIIQHIDEKFSDGLATWLTEASQHQVRLARSGDRPERGKVLLAGTNDHLAMSRTGVLNYVPEPYNRPYRPSVDVFFESAAVCWRGDLIGVILTGMGDDGAKGLKSMRDRGHFTIAQDEATCSVFGMPKAAIALGAAMEVLPLSKIGPRLQKLVAGHTRLQS